MNVAPLAVRDIKMKRSIMQLRLGWAVSEKRKDPGDQSSTNAGYLTDDEVTSKTSSSDSSGSSSLTSPLAELDTATSNPTGSHPGLIDDSPPHP